MTVRIWLKDGSVLKDWNLKSAEIKVGGLPFDINALSKIDSAYLYTASAKISRERVTGTIDLEAAGLSGTMKLSVDQISDLSRN